MIDIFQNNKSNYKLRMHNIDSFHCVLHVSLWHIMFSCYFVEVIFKFSDSFSWFIPPTNEMRGVKILSKLLNIALV